MMILSRIQQEAVQSIQYPTLIVAVPGAGKTRVIVEKYLYLFNIGYPLEKIVAITFTNKAADEMQNRLKNNISKFIKYPYISTFHSFALRLMVENRNIFNFKQGSTIIDDEDSFEIVNDIIKTNDLDLISPQDAIKYIFDIKENYKEDIILKCYKNAHHLLLENKISKNIFDFNIKNVESQKLFVFSEYQRYLYNSSLYDYADLILYPLLTMKLNSEAREIVRMQFDYFLVDEYQDVNNLQNQFLIMVTNGANITAVGDEDQAIYGFRGGSIEPIMSFEKYFKNAKIIYMDENYRSKKKIIDFANKVICENQYRRDKLTKAIRKEEGEVELVSFEEEFQMINYIVEKINYLIERNVFYEDIAILARTGWLLLKIQKKFIELSIPYKMLRGVNFFERKEIKYTIYYISFKLNPDNEFLFKRICSYPKKGIGPKTIEKIILEKQKKNINFIEALISSDSNDAKEFGQFLIKLNEISSLTKFCKKLLDEGGFLEEWQKDEETFNERVENFKFLLNLAQQIEDEFVEERKRLKTKQDIDIFQLFLSRVIPYYKEETSNEGVILGTLHSAKGLEFNAVILPYVSETILPYVRNDEVSDEEEERRLLYVGMTRAKDYLYILHSNKIELRGSKLSISKLVSPLIKNYLVEKKDENIRFRIGDYVKVENYGYGRIIDCRRLRNGKIVYIIENDDGRMQFIDGIHKISKKEDDYYF